MTSKRTISAANETAFLQANVKIVIFARFDFASGVKLYHTEIGAKTATHPVHGAESYLGIGDFGGLSSAVKESVSGSPQALSISLTGAKSALITDALTDDYFRREAEIMIGLEDEAGDLIDDPEILFSGFMDKATIALTKTQAQMTLFCESRGTNLQRASDLRYTDEDKQAEVTGDLMAEYVFRMLDVTLQWGGMQINNPFGPEQVRPGPGNPRQPGPGTNK